ncbi:MAG: enoyl-CoA hydratase/isomerase family protein [Chloroflexota bacterium]|nr:enoyl-CoA hydratase/isomerase family protein [Chloroflexota bacterium]
MTTLYTPTDTLLEAPTLRCELDADGIALLTINRPERRNAIDTPTMHALAALLPRLAEDARLRALIVTGAGTEAFCSGGDLNDFSERLTAELGAAMVALMGDTLLSLERLPIPVIAAINGFALGGGSELALACDLRVIDERAQLGFVHLRRGLIPGWGGGQRLLRAVGYARALELLLRAEPLDVTALVELGLVVNVTPPGEALAGALTIARTAARHDRAAVAAAKAMLQAGLRQPYDDAIMTERGLFPPLWVGEAHMAAMRAFIDKRR